MAALLNNRSENRFKIQGAKLKYRKLSGKRIGGKFHGPLGLKNISNNGASFESIHDYMPYSIAKLLPELFYFVFGVALIFLHKLQFRFKFVSTLGLIVTLGLFLIIQEFIGSTDYVSVIIFDSIYSLAELLIMPILVYIILLLHTQNYARLFLKL